MKKLLYVSFENSENPASGVNKKIFGQITAFEKNGFAVDLIAVHGSDIALFHEDIKTVMESKSIPRISLCCWARKNAANYDVAYVRFQFFCPFVLNMVKAFHRAKVKTVMEIPTYPYIPELKKQGKKGIHKRIVDATYRNACAKYIDRFAAPFYANPIMGKACLEIRNGINTDDVIARVPQQKDGKIHLLAVAMMAPWHGYDRMIEGIHRYYAMGGKKDLIFHLVGQGAASANYQKMVDGYSLHDHVILHGKMSGTSLERMYDIADIGVGSLGIHRIGVSKTNTLKVLEYFAKGIPIICEHSECGVPIENSYRLTVPDDDTPIDLEQVLNFYDSIYKNEDIYTVADNVREQCQKNCSVMLGMKPVLDYYTH